jgi:hypothetical protein
VRALALVLLVVLVPSITAQSSPPAEPTQVSATLVYEGQATIYASGRFLEEVLGDLALSCSEELRSIWISVNYELRVSQVLYPRPGDAFNVSLIAESLSVFSSSTCIAELVKNLILNITELRGAGTPPLLLVIERGKAKLGHLDWSGVVVGITRYGVDVVQIKDEYSHSSITQGSVIRSKDLYYEPITRVPFHYTEVLVNSTAAGEYTYVAYITLSRRNLDYASTFKNLLKRMALEVAINTSTTGSQFDIYRTTLIVIYAEPPSSNISVSFKNSSDTIRIEFSENTLCFLEIGPVREGLINVSVEVSQYEVIGITGREVVYYTPRSVECREIVISLKGGLIAWEKEAEYPEKLPPPLQITGGSLSDIAVVLATLVMIFGALYKLTGFITKKLIKLSLSNSSSSAYID